MLRSVRSIPAFSEFQRSSPQPPPPAAADLQSFKTLRRYNLRTYGFAVSEAELRQQRAENQDGRVGKERAFPGYAMLLSGMKKYDRIPVPALFVFAIPERLGAWSDDIRDPRLRGAAAEYVDAIAVLKQRQAKAIEETLATARVVRLPANHYVFLSNVADVLREVRAFVGAPR